VKRRGCSIVLLATVVAACHGPLGPIAGGALSGRVVRQPVADWSFANEYAHAQIETRPQDPYSVTVNDYVAGGRLYIDIGKPGDWNRWRRYIHDDPRVRVRFGEEVYELVAVPVDDRTELTQLLAVYYAKSGSAPPRGCVLAQGPEGCVPDGATFVRLDPRR
jgi:hypothetical protein